MSGTLYLVATPIGNLEDITLRALRVLKEVALIACEDTRHTRQLLEHHGIAARTISYHEHNERERAAELAEQLAQGTNIALVTDAGTPGISDPGYRLVALAVERGIPVVPVPGAAAFVCALAASGLPTDHFEFHGFLPARSSARRQALEVLRGAASTQIFYEAPRRLIETLEDVAEILGAGRPVVVAREVTKLHEEFLRGPAGDVLATLRARAAVKGEITLLIGRAAEEAAPAAGMPSLAARMKQLMREESLDEKTALKRVAREMKISRSEAYRLWQRVK
jgi:16S rRNA (cytidine1402-2'-O)-methyltransferase